MLIIIFLLWQPVACGGRQIKIMNIFSSEELKAGND